MTTYSANPTWLALCADIRAKPDDDLPRLVAADWLDENGDPDRAQLIRTQIEFVGTEGRAGKVRLFEAAISLLYDHGQRWFGFNPSVWGYTSNRVNYPLAPCVAHVRRGFFDSAEVTLAEWVRVGPLLVRENPVRSIAVIDKQPEPWSHQWVFLAEQPPTMPHQLPRFLWGCFGGGVWPAVVAYSRRYPTRKAANDALAAACLSWADTAAKLFDLGLEPVVTR